jgi:hypothetical protein
MLGKQLVRAPQACSGRRLTRARRSHDRAKMASVRGQCRCFESAGGPACCTQPSAGDHMIRDAAEHRCQVEGDYRSAQRAVKLLVEKLLGNRRRPITVAVSPARTSQPRPCQDGERGERGERPTVRGDRAYARASAAECVHIAMAQARTHARPVHGNLPPSRGGTHT